MDRSLGSGVLGLAIGLGCGLAIQVSGAQQPSTPATSSGQSTQTPAQSPPAPAGRGRGMAFTEPSPSTSTITRATSRSSTASASRAGTATRSSGASRTARSSANPRRPTRAATATSSIATSMAKDFTLKFEIKIEGDGGSGIQYRSQTGLPWLANIPANVTANVGPVNLNWMMTGPQADFWPSRVYTGQFYSENTPMRILAWRGQVVEGFGATSKTLMGTIGDRAGARQRRQDERLEPVHRHRARRHVPAHRQRPADGGDDRRRSGVVEQSARHVRHRDRGDDQGVGPEYLGEEAQLTRSKTW